MAEWVILKAPTALVIYGIGLFLLLFERNTKASRGWLVLLTAVFFLTAVGLDILMGASLREAAALTMIPLLFNMGGIRE